MAMLRFNVFWKSMQLLKYRYSIGLVTSARNQCYPYPKAFINVSSYKLASILTSQISCVYNDVVKIEKLQMIPRYFDHFKRLKKSRKSRQLAIEIVIILAAKVMLLWLLWVLFFSHPIAKDTRQSAVTRMLLNHVH
jgi:hypothetical protein